jgi:hypothetical protein
MENTGRKTADKKGQSSSMFFWEKIAIVILERENLH